MGGGTIRYLSLQSKNWGGDVSPPVPPRIDAPAHYVFSLMNVGDFGSNNDSGVLENSAMCKAFECNQMGLPDQQHVEGCKIPLSYFLVGNDIFALKSWLLRSFPRRSNLSEDQQIYNYRLYHAHDV